MRYSPYALAYASQEIKDDKNFAQEVIELNEWVLEDLSERLQDDEELVMKAVSKYGAALKYASHRL